LSLKGVGEVNRLRASAPGRLCFGGGDQLGRQAATGQLDMPSGCFHHGIVVEQ
jgi:hypothetical protein